MEKEQRRWKIVESHSCWSLVGLKEIKRDGGRIKASTFTFPSIDSYKCILLYDNFGLCYVCWSSWWTWACCMLLLLLINTLASITAFAFVVSHFLSFFLWFHDFGKWVFNYLIYAVKRWKWKKLEMGCVYNDKKLTLFLLKVIIVPTKIADKG